MDEISFGPVQPRRRVTWRRAGVAAAAGLGITLGAAGIAAAADSPSPSPSSGTTAQTAPMTPGMPGMRPRHMGDRGGPRGERGMGLRGAVHGEFVVPDGRGGWRKVLMQRGTVTDVSKTALTVKSADGYTKTYVLTAGTLLDAGRDGIDTVATNDKVGVVATVSGDTSTATRVRDLTKIQAERKQWGGPGAGGPPGGPGEGGPLAPDGTPATPGSYGDGAATEGA